MHNASFQALGLDAIYLAFDVEPGRLMEALTGMNAMGFGGVNLTVPLKEVAFRELDHLDDSAALLGAVNTIAFEPGGLTGHNTDGFGFLRAVQEAFNLDIPSSSLFVLGTGGAGRAVALAAAREGAPSITLADLDEERSQRVREEIISHAPNTQVLVVTNPEEQAVQAREAGLVVQATPVGMKEGDVSILGPEAFREGQCAFDLIYHMPETVFMQAAAQGGAKAVNGLGMLLHQGAQAFTIWTGQDADTQAMRTALEQEVYGT
jgi:shikimate dehydrogenase